MVRGKHAGVRDIFQDSGSDGSSLWVRGLGDDPLHGPGPGGFPAQGGPQNHGKEFMEASEKKLVAPPLGGGDAVGGFGGVGGVCTEDAEYFHELYCDANYYEPLRGSGVETRDTGIKTVVGTGGVRLGGSTGVDGGGS